MNPAAKVLPNHGAHRVDIEIYRPEDRHARIIIQPLYMQGAIEGIVHDTGPQVLELGLKLLPVSALIELRRRGCKLGGGNIASLLGRELKGRPLRPSARLLEQ